jgi:curved DNA-binding protein CbpA
MNDFDFINDDILEDYYELLDLKQTATIDEIRKNYLKMAKKYHPDHNNGNTIMFQKVSKAYECLSKKESRKNYDLEYNNIHEKNNPHTLSYFKNEHKNFVNGTHKELTKEEIKALEDTLNSSKIDESRMDKNNLEDKISNKRVEREMNDIELQDETLNNILKSSNDININDLFEFMKFNKEKELITTPSTYDLMPNYGNNYSSFDNITPISGTNYSNYNLNYDFTIDENKKKNFNINEFNEWKQNKKEEPKLKSSDIEELLKKREEETKLIENTINDSFKDFKKQTEIRNFLQIKNEINLDDF